MEGFGDGSCTALVEVVLVCRDRIIRWRSVNTNEISPSSHSHCVRDWRKVVAQIAPETHDDLFKAASTCHAACILLFPRPPSYRDTPVECHPACPPSRYAYGRRKNAIEAAVRCMAAARFDKFTVAQFSGTVLHHDFDNRTSSDYRPQTSSFKGENFHGWQSKAFAVTIFCLASTISRK